MKNSNNGSRTLLVIAKDQHGSSTRYRAGQFRDRLAAAGWEMIVLAVGDGQASRGQMLQMAQAADVVLVLRKTFGPLVTRLLKRASKRLLFDFDDAIFVASSGKGSRTRYRRFARMIRCCDQVWAGNSYLQQWAEKINCDVQLVPTVVDEQRYPLASQQPDGEGWIDLVWIGSRSTRKYLQTLIPVLNQLAEERSNIRLKIVADFELEGLQLPQLAIPWSEQNEAEALATAHIGLAPLLDNDWTRGKCGLKVLQYMAAGLPVVTDAVGVNEVMVSHRQTGFVVNGVAQWCEVLLSLSGDEHQRRRMGEAGRQRLVQGGYTVSANAKQMISSLNGLCPYGEPG